MAAMTDGRLTEIGKLHGMLAMPTEGFAFSENPPMRPRALHFDEADFTVAGHKTQK